MLYFFIWIFKDFSFPLRLTQAMGLSHVRRMLFDALISLSLLPLFLLLHSRILILSNRPHLLPAPVLFSFCEFLSFLLGHVPLFSPMKHLANRYSRAD